MACTAGLALVCSLVFARNAVVPDPLDKLRQRQVGQRTIYEGSWWFPRGGPYILGFDSPAGDATLAINGRVIARGRGLRKARVVYPPGAVAVKLEAPDGARLLWHPPGRRGPLEYVPPTSLTSAPPTSAQFGSWVGASPRDGGFALAIVLVMALALGYVFRGALGRVDKRTWLAVLAIFAVALAIRLWDLGGAGQTWDEDVNWSAGRNYVTNLLSLDFSEDAWRWNYQHPPVMKYVAGIGAQFADGYGPARALSAMMVALACAFLIPIGKRLLSLRAGILAGLIAALTPHVIAHSKVVGHEAPTMLLWVIGIWLAITAHDRPDTETTADRARALKWRMAAIGLVFGLAVFSRFVNALMAPALGALLLLFAPPVMRKKTILYGFTIIPVVAVVVGYAIWPLLWPAPIEHLAAAWDKLKKPHGLEPFFGEMTSDPSRIYFLVYLLVTAPVGILALAGVGFFRRQRATLAIAIWIAAPLLVLFSPVRQDGVRYIMPSLLALAMAAAAGVELIVRRFPDHKRHRIFVIGSALAGLYLAITCARIHPYYLDYYGEHVGGPSTVAKHRWFEIAWWGEGLWPAIAYINEHADEGARVHKRCVAPSHLAWLRADLWAREASRMQAADWILIYAPATRRCKPPPDFQLAFETEAQGAPLARVYRRPD